jgi:hypothetical protein
MADGNLTFDTKIDTGGFKKGVDTLKKSMTDFKSSINSVSNTISNAFGGNVSSKIVDLNGKISQTESQIKQLQSEMEKMANTEFKSKESDTLTKQVEKAEQQMLSLLNQREALENSLSSGISDLNVGEVSPNSLKSLYENNAQWKKLSQGINQAEIKLQQYEKKLEEVKQADSATKTTETDSYNKKQIKLQQLINKLNTYKTKLEEVKSAESKNASSMSGSTKAIKKITGATDKANKSTKGYNNTLNMLKMSLMYSLTFGSIFAVFSAMKEGMQNLARYSPAVNADLSLLMSSLTQLKNAFATAFAPILSFITPALNYLIQLLVGASNAIAQFFTALGGKSTYVKASKVQQDYAASLEDTGKSAKKAAKDVKKSITSIDDVTILTDNSTKDSTGGGSGANELSPNQMFDTASVGNSMKQFVDRFKAELATLFEPIKAAWDQYGQGTMDAFHYALNSILSTVSAIYDSFKSVWTGGSGEEVVSNILQIFTNIFTTIGNIATAFKKAWDKNDTGTKIIQDMFNILNNFLGLIKNVTKATSDWSKNLDLSPILTSFQKLTSSLEPLTSTIANGLSWLYKNVLLPLASWTITNVIPLFFTGLSAVLTTVNGVIIALEPLGQWLFDKFLKPLAEWTGGVITDILTAIVDKLKGFSDWIKENQKVVENMAIVIGSFMLAWKTVDLVVTIAGIVSALATFVVTGGLATVVAGALGAAIGILTSPITIVIGIIGSLIAIGVLLYKNWETVKAKAIGIWGSIKTFIGEMCNKIGSLFSALWTGIQTLFKGVGTWFTARFKEAYNGIIGLFKGIGPWFGQRWGDIKGVFSGTVKFFGDLFSSAWNGIKTAFALTNIVKFFNGIWSGIKGCFSKVTIWFKDTFSSAWKAVKDVFSTGGKVFDGIKDGIADTFKSVVQKLIDGINRIISTPFNAINNMLNKIRDVGVLGKKPFSGLWSANPIDVPHIPALATGTVVPANYGNFLATLGDNKREPEVVSPLSTMKQAFKEAMKESGGTGGNINLTVNLDGQTVYKTVVKYNNQNTRITGKNILAT